MKSRRHNRKQDSRQRRAVTAGRSGTVALRLIAALISAAVTIALAVTEIDIVGYDFCAAALVAVVVLPVTDLKSAFHHSHATLAEIFADEFSGSSPGNDVDEIRFLFPGLAFEIAVAGDGEAGHRKAGLCTAQFRVTGQSAHDNNLIQHRFPPPVLPRH